MFKRIAEDKNFYKTVLLTAIPIMIQNGITNFVGLLDNMMIGRIGTEQMSGVSIVNQLIFVYNICIFGGISGSGIFTAQFYGSKDHEGVRNTFRFKIITVAVISAAAFIIFGFFSDFLISLYLTGDAGTGDPELTRQYALQYMLIMMAEIIPFALSQVYTGTLRETDRAVLPMKAGIAAVIVNFVFNYILIFGKFGFPALGVRGAAAATVLSRIVELLFIMLTVHTRKKEYVFMRGAYRTLKIPVRLACDILKKGAPLLANEILWALGMAVMVQCYSIRGLDVVAGLNISTTVSNLFNIVFISLGSAAAIIVGQRLGMGNLSEAKEAAFKLLFFTSSICVIIAVMLWSVSGIIPMAYNTSDEVRSIAGSLIRVSAAVMPLLAFSNCCYFSIRAGGKTFITFLFDCVFVWTVNIPLAYLLAHCTGLNIVPIYAICQGAEFIKCTIGFIMLKKGIWLNTLCEKPAE